MNDSIWSFSEQLSSKVVLSFLFISFICHAQPDVAWMKVLGGSGNDYIRRVIATSDGGYAAVGWTFSSGSRGGAAWLIKVDADGDTLWTQTYLGSGSTRGYSILETQDCGYAIAGEITMSDYGADGLLIKTDSQGNMEWYRTYSATAASDHFYSVAQTNDCGYFLCGMAYWPFYTDFFTVKTDSLGEVSWMRSFGDGDWWERFSDGFQTSDGGYITAVYKGEVIYDPEPWYDDCMIVLMKLDSLGNTMWEENFDLIDNDASASLQVLGDDDYYIAGTTYALGGPGISNMLNVFHTSQGFGSWQYDSGIRDHLGYGLCLDSDGFVLAGHSELTWTSQNDISVVRTSPGGSLYWNLVVDGGGDESATCVQRTTDGGYIVSGFSDSYGSEDYDGILMKLESDLGIAENVEVSSLDLRVSPNPSSGQVEILYYLTDITSASITVYDIDGRTVQRFESCPAVLGCNSTSWTPTSLTSGIYFIRLEAESRSETAKLIICDQAL